MSVTALRRFPIVVISLWISLHRAHDDVLPLFSIYVLLASLYISSLFQFYVFTVVVSSFNFCVELYRYVFLIPCMEFLR